MSKLLTQYPKTESVSSIAPKQWTLHCLYSLTVGYWAIILGTLEVQVDQLSRMAPESGLGWRPMYLEAHMT